MRLALLLAAPFPLHQGSQVYVAGQARALRDAGALPVVVCYGAGDGGPEPVPVVRAEARLSPQTLRSSASPAKLPADVSLARTLVRAHAREPFGAVLAHNSEAAAVALAVRHRLRIPVVYVVHTLLRYELSAYGPVRLGPALDRVGGWLERALARHADAILALCDAARDELAPLARGPVAVVPPGLDPAPPPDPEACRRACARHGVEPGRFVLYAGNVDVYQDLDLLDAAAARLPGTAVLAASHDPGRAGFAALRVARVEHVAETRALLHACAVAVLPRRRPGGFPIKLLNYMEAGRAIVAHAGVGVGLEHGRSGWLLPPGAGPEAWATALRTLLGDPELRARLGAGARARLEARHAWPGIARETLALVRRAGAGG